MVTPSEEIFTFTVNGTEIKTDHEKLVAADILKLAERAGAIPTKPEHYILESTEEEHRFKNDEWVDLREYKAFLTVPTGKTDVADTHQ